MMTFFLIGAQCMLILSWVVIVSVFNSRLKRAEQKLERLRQQRRSLL